MQQREQQLLLSSPKPIMPRHQIKNKQRDALQVKTKKHRLSRAHRYAKLAECAHFQ